LKKLSSRRHREVIRNEYRKMNEFLSDMSPAAKKEILDNLVLTILKDLNETEKKDLLRNASDGQKEGRHLTSMVEY
jgi:hypothetical protein